VVIASLKEETPVLKEQNPVITDKTSAVILRMMDKNPNRRYPTYASLLADLEMALQGAKAAQQQAREDERQARQKANRGVPSFVWMLLGGLLLTVIVGGGLYLRHQKQQRQLAAVVYDGPRRELHQPFTKVEIRNLSLTAEGLAGLNFRQTDTALATAVKYLPERHAVTGWYHFFGAGLYFYAGKAELAREELRRVAEMNTMMFDGGRVPPEDPRILAYFALGDLSEEELGKTLRKSQGYYKQLATLARGYRSFFQDGATPQTAKFFKTFAEYRPYTGMAWPYVIQPLCSEMVLPRENDLYESFTVPSPGAPDEVSRVPSTLNPPVAYGSFAAS
jgi:cell division protein FtsB